MDELTAIIEEMHPELKKPTPPPPPQPLDTRYVYSSSLLKVYLGEFCLA